MRTIHSGVGVVTRRAHEVVRVVLPELIHEPVVLQAAGGRGHKVDGWTPFSRKHWTIKRVEEEREMGRALWKEERFLF